LPELLDARIPGEEAESGDENIFKIGNDWGEAIRDSKVTDLKRRNMCSYKN